MMMNSSSNTTLFPFLGTSVPRLLVLLCVPVTVVLLRVARACGLSVWRLRVCRSVQGLGVGDGHGVQDLVQQLQSPVQVDLDPARRLLDALPGVVGPPPLHKAEPQDAQAPQVVHADARRCRQTCKAAERRGRHTRRTSPALPAARCRGDAATDVGVTPPSLTPRRPNTDKRGAGSSTGAVWGLSEIARPC